MSFKMDDMGLDTLSILGESKPKSGSADRKRFNMMFLSMVGLLPAADALDVLRQYNRERPKEDLSERIEALFKESTLQEDLDCLGRDSPEAKALREIIAYSIDIQNSVALVTLINCVIHPILAVNKVLTEALANKEKNKTEEN